MKVLLGVSNRHLHLSEEDYKTLFGNEEVVKIKDLVQPGEYATDKIVSIKTSKNILNKVRLLYPFRKNSQVEISRTDSYFLGINPPVKNSGDLDGAEEVTIVGPKGEVTKKCCIIANRHLHITPEIRKELNLVDVKKISLVADTEKKTIFSDVFIRESENYAFEAHLDTDDGNAALLKTGDMLEIVKE